ncbi:response regulator [soil metagenome]
MDTYEKNNLKFVIVDDDRLTRSVLRVMLQDNQCAVIGEAIDGEAGVETCRRLQPDIAFVDIEMPRLDGHQATRKILLECPQARVIMISAMATVRNMQLALMAGASGFVAKPLDAMKVIGAIDHCLKQNR